MNEQKYIFIRIKMHSVDDSLRFYDHIPKRFFFQRDRSKDYSTRDRTDFRSSTGKTSIPIDLSKSI